MVKTAPEAGIDLVGDGGTIRIVPGEGNWSECWLIGQGHHYLGCDDLEHLLRRFLARVIDDEGQTLGEIEGVAVRWVLTMPLEYFRLYANSGHADRILIWMDLQGKVIGTIKLTASGLVGWKQKIDEELTKLLKAADPTQPKGGQRGIGYLPTPRKTPAPDL